MLVALRGLRRGGLHKKTAMNIHNVVCGGEKAILLLSPVLYTLLSPDVLGGVEALRSSWPPWPECVRNSASSFCIQARQDQHGSKIVFERK